MAKKNYPVINAFYLHGELVQVGDEVELDEEEAEHFAPKNVIGKPSTDKKTDNTPKE